LESESTDAADDAHKEFRSADYQDFRRAAQTLSPRRLAGWLRDPKISPGRKAVYAMLLGHCGTTADAKVIRGFLDDDKRLEDSDDTVFFRLMIGYVMLKPKEGWQYVRDTLKDEKK